MYLAFISDIFDAGSPQVLGTQAKVAWDGGLIILPFAYDMEITT